MARKYKTPLAKLQEDIDRCNHHSGCDTYCSPEHQCMCPKLRRHAERMEECRREKIPMHLW